MLNTHIVIFFKYCESPNTTLQPAPKPKCSSKQVKLKKRHSQMLRLEACSYCSAISIGDMRAGTFLVKCIISSTAIWVVPLYFWPHCPLTMYKTIHLNTHIVYNCNKSPMINIPYLTSLDIWLFNSYLLCSSN